MSRYRKLVGNSIVFAIGNFGSKIINLVMVPLYTFVLKPDEYGTVDLMTTTISLFLPIASLSIGEAVIRFIMKPDIKSEMENSVLSNAFFLNLISSVILLGLFPLLNYLGTFKNLLVFFLIQLVLSQFQLTFSQFVRGMGLVKTFALNGVLMTIVTAALNIILLVKYSLGLEGYLISLIIANSVSIIYLCMSCKAFNKIRFRFIEYNLIRQMAKYSVPLIPNMIMWWLINSSTRYFILFFINPVANGLFAVANKIPSILSMFTTIFQQAWQLSAFEEYESKDKGTFFSKTFEFYHQFLFIGAAFIISIIRPVVPLLIGEAYRESWKIIPFLLMAAVYQSFSSFLGTNYTAAMQTRGVFTSSVIGAITSVVINIVLIPLIGLSGAGIGTCISFFIMFVIRYFDTKKIIGMKINVFLFLCSNFLLILQIMTIFLVSNMFCSVALQVLLLIVLIIISLCNKRKIIKKRI